MCCIFSKEMYLLIAITIGMPEHNEINVGYLQKLRNEINVVTLHDDIFIAKITFKPLARR